MTKLKIKPAEQKLKERPAEQQIMFPSHIPMREKSIFMYMIDVMREDFESVFRIDRKTKENRMRYEEFMEMCKK